MFGFLRKNKPPLDPPTEKQLKYASRLDITVLPSMSKADVSYAISEAERRNPAQAINRENIKKKTQDKKCDKELIDKQHQWNIFSERVEYMLAIFIRGKNTIVEVLRVNEALITERGKLKLGVEAPKVVKDRHIGDYLDWDKYFELPFDAILHYEPLHTNFHDDGNDAYRKVIEKGLLLANNLK